MSRTAFVAGVLSCVGLLTGLVIGFPARIALGALPAPLRCDLASGTLWHGRCERLMVDEVLVGSVGWRLQAGALWRGRLRGGFGWRVRADALQGRFDAGHHDLQILDLQGELGLGSLRALPFWPPALAARLAPAEGRLRLDLARIELRTGRLHALRGVIEGFDLAWHTPQRLSLGGLRATFPGDGLDATITDTGGPLEFAGRLALDAAPAWSLTGTIRARDPLWAPRLAVFGPPDADGRRSVSVEGR